MSKVYFWPEGSRHGGIGDRNDRLCLGIAATWKEASALAKSHVDGETLVATYSPVDDEYEYGYLMKRITLPEGGWTEYDQSAWERPAPALRGRPATEGLA